MKKAQRTSVIMHILTDNPNKDFGLGYFAEKFSCAKSSISEDIKLVKETIEDAGLGYLETTAGMKGGVRFVPYVSDAQCKEFLEVLREKFSSKDRVLGNKFIYTSDLFFDPHIAKGCARIFAKKYASMDADMIVTVETKGIGVALFTAELLNLPLIVVRHESKVSDGSTVSINYFSGSTERVQQMSLAKRSIKPGSKAIIIDDFARGGGSISGIVDMLSEFDSSAVACGVVAFAGKAPIKNIKEFNTLLLVRDNPDGSGPEITINPDLLS